MRLVGSRPSPPSAKSFRSQVRCEESTSSPELAPLDLLVRMLSIGGAGNAAYFSSPRMPGRVGKPYVAAELEPRSGVKNLRRRDSGQFEVDYR